MNSELLRKRTKDYALRIIKLIEALPKTTTGGTIANQLIRSGTSIGANYRAALRGRSKVEFIAKLGIVIEEADESTFWLELIIESSLLDKKLVEPLLGETKELLAIFITTINTAKRNNKN
jgi:four helix bundle protein